jgi:hypothetical protein
MIRNVHTTTLRELVAQAERDLAGYRRLLDLAEREERVGAVFPDPIAPAGAPWTLASGSDVSVAAPAGREPYPTTVMPAANGSLQPDPPAGEWQTRTGTCACGNPADLAKTHWANVCKDITGSAIDGSTLPPKQEAAIDTIWSQHDQHATSPKGIREDEQWRNA